MTTPSDSSATPVNAGPAGPVLRAVVLLRTTPPGVGAVLDLLLPDLSPQIRDLPLNRLTVTVNDVAVTFEVAAGPLVARELDYAVRQSPLRDLVQAAVAQHEGFLVLSADSGEDIFRASELLANVAATYAKDDNGLAVWPPEADHVTTDVMYVGEVAQRSAQTWFHTMAARMDETSSIAHTIGVHHLGGGDVQLRTSSLDPAGAHRELRGAVATLLEARTFPTPGTVVTIAGAPHVLTPASSVLGMGDVLEAVPTASPPAPPEAGADRPKRRGWFGRR